MNIQASPVFFTEFVRFCVAEWPQSAGSVHAVKSRRPVLLLRYIRKIDRKIDK